jgi:hypothetical protein
MRDLSLVGPPSGLPVHTSVYGAQSKIQANHCPPPRPRIPTHYVITNKSFISLSALALGLILPFLGF